ncbi:thioesterase domain-containing protein [Streptomyces sp. NPDC004031]
MSTMHATAPGTATAESDFTSLWESRRPRRTALSAGSPVELSPGKGTPLFLFPWTEGNIVFVRDFAPSFGNGHPVLGFEARGLWSREEPFLSVADAADACVREIRRIQPRGPYLLGGMCGGCQTAYEVAVRLVAAGERVGPLNLVNAARGALASGPLLGLCDVYDMRLAALRRQFGVDDLAADLDRVMDRMRAGHWIDDATPREDFFWRQLVWSAGMYANRRCRLGTLDLPVNVFIARENAHDPEVRWHDVAPRSTVTAVDGVSSVQIMRSPAYLSAMRRLLSQDGS